MNRCRTLKQKLLARHPSSDLIPLDSAVAAELRKALPGIPEELLALYQEIGVGRIGASSYMIHDPSTADAFFAEEDARGLDGIVIVGDNFSGSMDAYDARNGWRFGYIDSECKFVSSSEHSTLSELLADYYANDPS